MEFLFGTVHNVTLAQECARAALVFIYGFFILRIAGRRAFGKWSALDFVVSIVIGSSLARVITGEAPINGTFCAAAIMIVMHWALSWGVAHSDAFSRLIEGTTVQLSDGASIYEDIRKAHLVSNADLEEAMRMEGLGGLVDLSETKRLHLEPSGKISVVKLRD